MRALPDQPHDEDYPKEEWIDQGDKEQALDPKKRHKQDENAVDAEDGKEAKEDEKQKKDHEKTDEVMKQENPEDEEQTGDYVNYEISFA